VNRWKSLLAAGLVIAACASHAQSEQAIARMKVEALAKMGATEVEREDERVPGVFFVDQTIDGAAGGMPGVRVTFTLLKLPNDLRLYEYMRQSPLTREYNAQYCKLHGMEPPVPEMVARGIFLGPDNFAPHALCSGSKGGLKERQGRQKKEVSY